MAQTVSPLPTTPADILHVVRRRKWQILVPFLVIGGLAAFLAHALPSVYRSSTTILVVKAQVPETFVRSTVTAEIDDRLATITQQILSRTRLERIIKQFDLYAEERATQPMDAVVARMRRAIEVEVQRGNNAFTVSFVGSEPRLVRDVTNELAAVFIEENSKIREELAANTSQFLDTQLEALKQTLNEQERQVREFKERYMGQLPQQQEANLRLLDRLQSQSQAIADRARAAEERRLLLQAQLGATPKFNEVVVRVTRSGSGAGRETTVLSSASPRDTNRARLEEARATLLQLRTRYTEAHPDVVRARRQLEELEAIVAGGGVAATDAPGESTGPDDHIAVDEIRQVPNPVYEQIQAQLRATDREIEYLRASHRDILANIEVVQRKVESVPKLEQQLADLTRDYNNTQASYQALLSKKLEAEMAEDLERRQKSEQFRVLDPAVLPQTPYRPNRAQILAVGLVAALGVGAGGALGLELLKGAVRSPADLKALAPRLSVLGVIPTVEDRARLRRRRLLTALGVALFLVAYGAGAAAALAYKDRIVRLPGVQMLVMR
ncbi:MAG TPA: XrtA system polysaccharide chain length determinant [Thermodesulfobacteriota bacterium]